MDEGRGRQKGGSVKCCGLEASMMKRGHRLSQGPGPALLFVKTFGSHDRVDWSMKALLP